KTHPIRRAALEAEALEDEAKHLPGKDALSLFTPGQGLVYHWDDFSQNVLEEKLGHIRAFFGTPSAFSSRLFLFRILTLLRSGRGQINLAHFAYLLAKMEPSRASTEELAFYRRF